MRTDVEIASTAALEPITAIGEALGLADEELELYGRHKAKVRPEAIFERGPGDGRLVLVTGLTDGLRRQGRRAVACIREPSLGPVFGIKGGAAGGGYSQVIPMADINLHFTGDLHAITSAHALLSAMLDNHMHHGNTLGLDPRQITWRRAVDMNDRALRNVVVGLGGRINGVPREDGFMITAASEVMAIFCLAADHTDLEDRLGRIIVGYTLDGEPVRAASLNAPGAMNLLLRDALAPNLVQTLEHSPAFVHGGPFANIAHGCSSLMATRAGLALADVVITEAGFGSDLGAEKFFDIKCRVGGLKPEATVIVATVRALKLHGGVSFGALGEENVAAVEVGLTNLEKHVENMAQFGVPAIVALNVFEADTEAELAAVEQACSGFGVPVARSEGHARGGEGCERLAEAVMGALDSGKADFAPLYDLDRPLAEKIEEIATRIYGADGVDFSRQARRDLDMLEVNDLGGLPVCIAKTPNSLTDDAKILGRPSGFRITVQDARPSAGAGFVVVRTGDVMTMPGLAKVPAAEGIRLTPEGEVVGLF
jgi:formate--tetrahydrofolate ligase